MTLLNKITFGNNLIAKILLVVVIALCVCLIGSMFGKFLFYLTH